jgi:hypothetical protein
MQRKPQIHALPCALEALLQSSTKRTSGTTLTSDEEPCKKRLKKLRLRKNEGLKNAHEERTDAFVVLAEREELPSVCSARIT